MREFRFSQGLASSGTYGAVAAECRRAERDGYDAVYAADHLGIPAPFQLLVAAARATERLRVGTLVLNAEFWNPALLAREAATADLLTGGRLELGLGAGHMKWEFDEAGVPWRPIAERTEHLRAVVRELGRLFGSDGYEQQHGMRTRFGLPALRPVQRHGFGGAGPPLIVGGTGDRVLDVAAEHADIVSIAGLYQRKGEPPGTLRLGSAAEADDRVRYVRERAGARAESIEWHALAQAVVVTDDRREEAERLLERFGQAMSPEELLECPFVFVGTVEEMAEQVMRNRQRYGFTHYTVLGPYAEAFAPVVARVRELAVRD
ncbi:TIGR03621 family F420-dependent LLM class oxidoreductase [Streptomyces bathyalis]|uniref:TIGR03621 family F420-dependent LLM class oxidoreductase n=1 Tax=Streptomyces bathyalis TaxID=2710756 RepID=A0A7T1WU03_9ACTN|nr:TIGR03621 family F420-dependent LLM class oxidoreductase [Streptomyces bathyalis]QPP07375.1 TIGR03621 family F420-dependent LLM class oxidoreductase [Streptomyces bathyalis]